MPQFLFLLLQTLHGKHAAYVTKELGLEEMEHAAFDPEVAAAYHEDGLDPEDLGYEADYEEEESDGAYKRILPGM